MRIGIDARLINETGVGRYIRNLLYWLNKVDNSNEYVIFTPSKTSNDIFKSQLWKQVDVNIRWHTLKEQLLFPYILTKYKLDIMHFPYFSIPIFYPGKFIVTIHDLTNMNFPTGKASTLPVFLYKIKYTGYRIVLNRSLLRAEKVIVPSESVASEIQSQFPKTVHKVAVTYEGKMENNKVLPTKLPFEPFFLYVGNLYPHKNLKTALLAIKKLNSIMKKPIKLVIVGKKDAFYKRTYSIVEKIGIRNHVKFLGEVSDGQLANLYQRTICLLFPSLSEGFGLPAVEAMQYGCLIACSDIPVFREICKQIPFYFNPNNVESITTSLEKILSLKYEEKTLLQQEGKKQSEKFNWKDTAQSTLKIYDEVVR